MSRVSYGTMPASTTGTPMGNSALSIREGSSSAALSPTLPKYLTRQVYWPGSDRRVSITAGDDKQNGPIVIVTHHDGELKEVENGGDCRLDPTPFASGSVNGKNILCYDSCMTKDGRSVEFPSRAEDTSERIVIPANSEKKVLLNDGWDGEKDISGWSQDTRESKLEHAERRALNQFWSELDIQSAPWYKLPLSHAVVSEIKPSESDVNGDPASRPCTVQWVFSQKPFPSKKAIESTANLTLPSIPSPHDPEGTPPSRSIGVSMANVNKVETKDVDDWDYGQSWEISDPRAVDGSIWVSESEERFKSPVEANPSITVTKGFKNRQPRMLVRYNRAGVRSVTKTLYSERPPETVTSKAELVPLPIRAAGRFPIDRLEWDNGTTITLEDLLKIDRSEIPSNVATVPLPAGLTPENETWTEHHKDHGLFKKLAFVIRDFGSEFTTLPLDSIEVTGLWNDVETYDPGRKRDFGIQPSMREKPLVVAYTYCHPPFEQQDEDGGSSDFGEHEALLAPGTGTDREPPPDYYDGREALWWKSPLSCCFGGDD